jgi:hypothetical protein
MNNNQINNTSYYQLPCGKFLEDFIYNKGLNFAEGSALKYLWRAGKKDGETAAKDMGKCTHYCSFLAEKNKCDTLTVFHQMVILADNARDWDGVL